MDAATLQGRWIAVTGRLASMSHSEFAALVAARGGVFQTVPTRGTSILVLGRPEHDGAPEAAPSRSLAIASRYRAAGYSIALWSEEEFLLSIGRNGAGERAIHQPAQGRFTIRQLSHITSVLESRLRTWARAGVIEPTWVVHRLALYDFHEAALAKRLNQLIDAGASIQDILQSLREMSWMGSAQRMVLRLVQIGGRRLAARTDDGRLAEPSGQLHFDFDGDRSQEPVLSFEPVDRRTADDWFRSAIEAEDAGEIALARDAYFRALALDGSDPVLFFNAANALYSLGEISAAVLHYQSALRLDPHYIEAWNNLGNALADSGDERAALAAYERAISIEPSYDDAVQNRSRLLETRATS